MADYKVVFRADEASTGASALLWEPSCPAMLTAVQVSRNVQTSEAYLQVKLRNVSGKKLTSICGVASVKYMDTSAEEVKFEDLDVDLAPGGQKAIKAIALPRGDVESATVQLTQVYSEKSKWSTSVAAISIPERAPLQLSKKAFAERRRLLNSQGIDARTFEFALQEHDGWWMCACGQINVGIYECCECAAPKSALLDAENELQLLASADEWSEAVYQKALALSGDKGNLAALVEAEELFDQVKDWKDASERLARCKTQITGIKHRSRRIAITAAVIAVAVIAAVLLAFNVFIPGSKYSKAISLEESGHYDEAIAIFESLDDYKDSRSRIFGIAERLYQAGEYQRAAMAFESLGDYEGAADKARKCLTEGINSALQGRWRAEHDGHSMVTEFNDGDYSVVEADFDMQLGSVSGGTYEIDLDTMTIVARLEYNDGSSMKMTFPILYNEGNLQIFLNSEKKEKFSKL